MKMHAGATEFSFFFAIQLWLVLLPLSLSLSLRVSQEYGLSDQKRPASVPTYAVTFLP